MSTLIRTAKTSICRQALEASHNLRRDYFSMGLCRWRTLLSGSCLLGPSERERAWPQVSACAPIEHLCPISELEGTGHGTCVGMKAQVGIVLSKQGKVTEAYLRFQLRYYYIWPTTYT
jgi:hypothetical protein